MSPTVHPLAGRAWSQLRGRSEADRRLVYNALQARLARGADTPKQEIALYALRHWMAIHEATEAPSRRRYDAYRGQQANRADWPSATLIRNAFGSWEVAAAVAEGRPLADVTVRRLTSNGQRIPPVSARRRGA